MNAVPSPKNFGNACPKAAKRFHSLVRNTALIAALGLIGGGLQGCVDASGQSQIKNPEASANFTNPPEYAPKSFDPLRPPPYSASSELIANPERGIYRHKGDCDRADYDRDTLINYREEQQTTLVMCLFYLRDFKGSPISQDALTQFEEQADTVRKAGLKMILRFAYTDSSGPDGVPLGDDAPLDIVLGHIDQLAPYLAKHSDVISVVQSGFVGTWGEGAYSQNFGNDGQDNWNDRKAVIEKLLSVLPHTLTIQVRRPNMKLTMYPSNDADTREQRRRIGHHNDCFLADPNDQGTYKNRALEYPYLEQDTLHNAMGGETCAVNPPRSECPTALDEMSKFHWSYLNRDWNPAVLATWSPCMQQVERQLGYRFSLIESTFPSTVKRGTEMTYRIKVRNDGFAAPYNPRPIVLGIRPVPPDPAHKSISSIPLHVDARFWGAGKEWVIQGKVPIPSSARPGTYELLLGLPDPSQTLANNPSYAIQMANGGNLWESTTGYNRLLRVVKITS